MFKYRILIAIQMGCYSLKDRIEQFGTWVARDVPAFAYELVDFDGGDWLEHAFFDEKEN